MLLIDYVAITNVLARFKSSREVFIQVIKKQGQRGHVVDFAIYASLLSNDTVY